MKAYRKHMLLTALLAAAVFDCWLASAQGETAAFNGQITDQDSLAVVGVRVQALNTATNVSYPADTYETGLYKLPALPAETYSVTATKDNFGRR